MFIEKLLRFLRGYVIIFADGLFCERFMNICMRRNIYLWGIKRTGEQRLCVSISIKGFRELREIARKTRTHITVVKRVGLPFILHRYRKRKALIVGAVLFISLIWYLTTHIVGIEVTGNNKISREEILKGLRENGVYHGAATDKIDDKTVQNKMMIKFDKIGWIGINIKGSRVYVDVRERLDTPIRVGADVPCDIVAAKDGMVKLLDIKQGQSMVKANQLVEKGDLLVSGVVDSNSVGMRYVHSFGQVYAETVYEKTGDFMFEYNQKEYTEKMKKRYTLSVMGAKLGLYVNKEKPFSNCDSNKSVSEYKTPLPQIPSLFVECETFREYNVKKIRRTEAQTLEVGKKELSALLDKEIPVGAQLTDRKVVCEPIGKKGIRVTVEYHCYEDIGSQRIIDKTELLGYDNIEKE